MMNWNDMGSGMGFGTGWLALRPADHHAGGFGHSGADQISSKVRERTSQ